MDTSNIYIQIHTNIQIYTKNSWLIGQLRPFPSALYTRFLGCNKSLIKQYILAVEIKSKNINEKWL